MSGLAYVIGGARGEGDRLLAEVAAALAARGWPLAGVVQINTDRGDSPCDMDLSVLGLGRTVRISQSLGPHSQGCRLDPEGLETAVGLVAGTLARGPRLMIVNKFGKAEVEGRGFRPLIGEALAAGIPVLTGVRAVNLEGFRAFAGGFEEALEGQVSAILRWCDAVAGEAGA
jgi:hypothetical protein